MTRKTNSVGLRLKATNKDYNHCWYGDILYSTNFEKSLSIENYNTLSLLSVNSVSPKISYIGAYKKANVLVCYLDVNTTQKLSESFNLKNYKDNKQKKTVSFLEKKCPKQIVRYNLLSKKDINLKEKFKFSKPLSQTFSLVDENNPLEKFYNMQKVKLKNSFLYTEKQSITLGLFFSAKFISSLEKLYKLQSYNDHIQRFEKRALEEILKTSKNKKIKYILDDKETSSYVTNYTKISSVLGGNFVFPFFVQSKNEKASASFLADYVSYFLERKVQFRRLKRYLNFVFNKLKPKPLEKKTLALDFFLKNQNAIAGCKICCSGRVGGRSKKAQRSRKETFTWGETGTHVFSSKLDFAKTSSLTPFGLVGIQVWICYK